MNLVEAEWVMFERKASPQDNSAPIPAEMRASTQIDLPLQMQSSASARPVSTNESSLKTVD